MKHSWIIDESDRERLQAFLSAWADDRLVQKRAAINLARQKPSINTETFWYWLVACLLTTQQRSGPHSPISRFLSIDPFPLALPPCQSMSDLAGESGLLLAAQGIRRHKTVGTELAINLHLVIGDGWEACSAVLESVRLEQTRESERLAARWLSGRLRGFGPKQSRNLLQLLGLFRYEIPIDSRIVKWLNAFGFPLPLSSSALADAGYYEFVLDAVHELCDSIPVFPCIFDASVFASFDKGAWSDAKVIW